MTVRLSILRDVTGRTIEKPGASTVAVELDREGKAFAFAGRELLWRLERARVAFISRDGFLVEGMEPCGKNRWRLQEWWCVPAAAGGEA